MSPEMSIDYYARSTLGGFWRQNWSNGMWAILPFAHVPEIAVRWRHLAPLALVLGLTGSAAAARWTGIEWLAWSVASLYIAANLAASVKTAWKERSIALAFRLPAVFASLHLAYGLGSLWGCVRAAVLLTKSMPRPTPEFAE
jgi:succinoglycan biosynthesis protein ExoA